MIGVVMNIYRYVVRYDGGSAPRPFGGICTLAICKPMIRRTAAIGDWIIGVRSRKPDEVVYVMQVEEILPFDKYWFDPRFEDRRPVASPVPDNFYRPTGRGAFAQEPNPIHGDKEANTDLGGRNVLLGRRYWYFGSASPVLPTELIHLVPYARGHSVHLNRKGDTDIKNLESWLMSWPCGIHGEPIDATDALKDWLSSTRAVPNSPSDSSTSPPSCVRDSPDRNIGMRGSSRRCGG